MPVAFDPVNQPLAGFGFRGIARLKPGMTIAQANADAARLLNVWMDSWTNGPGSIRISISTGKSRLHFSR